MKSIRVIIVLAALMVMACKNDTNEQPELSGTQTTTENASAKKGQAFIENDQSQASVLQIAMNSQDHTTLVAAVQAADLENSLSNAGPLTVFAPTNAAFDALPAGTVEDLLKPENKEKLAFILKHHVTPGNYAKDFMKKFKKVGQASGESVPVLTEGDDVLVGGAKIVASIPAGNGIVHVVDKVILPEN